MAHLLQVHAAPGMDLSNAERLYNPYEGLSTAIDARAGLPRNLYRLPEQPEFLFSEEAGVHKRSWSENLTYYTGLGYLSGTCLVLLKPPSSSILSMCTVQWLHRNVSAPSAF